VNVEEKKRNAKKKWEIEIKWREIIIYIALI
jgi:hypothetical protein